MAVNAPVQLGLYLSPSNVASGVCTLTTAAPVGAFVVVEATGYTSVTNASMTIADSKGNTWTLRAHADQTATATTSLTYVWTSQLTTALAVGDTVTVTRTVSAVRTMAIGVFSVGGVDSAAPVSTTATVLGSTSTTTPNGGSVASAVGDLVFTAMAWAFTGITVSNPTPSGTVKAVDSDANAHRNIVLYKQTSAAGSVQTGVTVSSSGRYSAVSLNLKASAANAAPTVNAGVDQTVDPNLVDSFDLVAVGTDTDGTIASYLWEDITSGAVTLAGSGTTRTVQLTTLRKAASQTRTYRCTVTDNAGATGVDTVDVVILPHTRWIKTLAGLVALRRFVT